MSFSISVELIAREIFHNLDKNKTVWIQNVNNWCSTTQTITYKFWVSPQCEIKMLHENYRKKRKSFSITNFVLFNYGWGHRHWNISQFGQKQNGLNSKCEQLVQYYWDHNLQVLGFTPVWNKNASWKLSEKKKVIFYEFFMSFWIRVELIAREIFHNLDKNKTVWIQNVNNWCSTPETRTHKFWSSPQCEIKMLHEHYRKKRKWFRSLFLSFWIRVEFIAREIFHNLDKNNTVWIQNVNNWCRSPETITYKFWVSPQCEIKMLHENYRKKRKSFSMSFLCPFMKIIGKKESHFLWLFYVLLN